MTTAHALCLGFFIALGLSSMAVIAAHLLVAWFDLTVEDFYR